MLTRSTKAAGEESPTKMALVRSKIEEAEQQLTIAEEEFSRVIRALRAAPRAEKTVTNTLIDAALGNLSAAKTRVIELKLLLVPDDEG
ncbi:hypothetical protein [Chondromyces apiculatus]|uniref:Uncharacterized protein n=1 Tax=Chondromyces apiculatus DSM 436 TaxID=1192034 RepID=A0A017T5D2_9BACT|nr:hypothetical protein [Chondromyces apiculatus]EYF04207.1 Hypothetical protein CAP_4684 [Chondromyces apiculatus DSM 436]